MKTIGFVLFVASLFVFCGYSNTNKVDKKATRRILLSREIPFVNGKGNAVLEYDTVYITFHEDLIIYEFPHYITSEYTEGVINEKVEYNRFIFQKNNSKGLWYKYNTNVKGKFKIVDSVLLTYGVQPNSFNKLNNIIFISKNLNKDRDIVHTYIPAKMDTSLNNGDSLLFYYSNKLNGVNYTFSEKMDTVKNYKLHKIDIICKPNYHNGYSFKFPLRKFVFEFNEIPITNITEINSLVESYRKEFH